MTQWIMIDGSRGEGGGQVLRSALALSLCTGRPFCIRGIRAKRRKPGLLRQHLTAVQAAAAISGALVEGDEIGSQQLRFAPGPVRAGEYEFAIGTAGSTGLVLQSILYPLLLAKGESRLRLSGGTHNPMAPPADFLRMSLLPLLNRMGPKVTLELKRYGFFPAGGGEIEVHILPAPRLHGFSLLERGPIQSRGASALIANLPGHVAQRELQRVAEALGWAREELQQRSVTAAQGPGNVLLLQLVSEQVCEVFTGFGQPGVRAERVADETIAAAQRYLAAEVPVGEYLADQLLLPLALAGSGEFRSLRPSEHTLTHIGLIQRFLPIAVEQTQLGTDDWCLRLL